MKTFFQWFLVTWFGPEKCLSDIPPVKQKHQNRAYWHLGTLLVLTLCAALLMPQWTVDDAYISFRYGLNLWNSGDLNWNPGEMPIEGFTGYLLPLIGVLSEVISCSPALLADFLNGLALASGIIWMWQIMGHISLRPLNRVLLIALFLFNPLTFMHTYSGLETVMFLALLLGNINFFCRFGSVKGLNLCGMILVGIGLILVRPEGLGVIFVLLASTLLNDPIKHIRKLMLVAGPVLLFALMLHSWRYLHFGALFPNTFYAKQFGGWNPESTKSLIKLAGLSVGLPLLTALPGFWYWLRNGVQRQSTEFFLLCVVTMLTLLFGLGYHRSHLFMNYGHRMYFPLVPPWLILVAMGWKYYPKAFAKDSHRTAKLIGLIGVLFLQAVVLSFEYQTQRAYVLRYRKIMETQWQPATEFLRMELSENESVIAYQDAGWIGYRLRFAVIDFGRLNDRYLAREQPEPHIAADYFFAQNARAVVMTSFAPEEYQYFEEAMTIQSDPRFARYQLVRKFTSPGVDDYAQYVYLRRDQ